MDSFTIFYESTYVYKIPKDRGDLLFDFYMLSHLKGLVSEKEGQVAQGVKTKGPTPDQVRLTEDDISIIEHAYDTVLKHLRKHMLASVYYGIVREMRHLNTTEAVGHYDDSAEDEKEKTDDEMIDKYGKDWKVISDMIFKVNKDATNYGQGQSSNIKEVISGPAQARAIIKQAKDYGIVPSEVVRMAYDLFKIHPWADEYGGDSWAEICEGWLLLNRAKGDQQIAVAIDHLYDLQHNNGSILNKIREYGPTHNWLLNALDFKRNIKNFAEILPYISPGLKTHARRILYKTEGPRNRPTVDRTVELRQRVLSEFEQIGLKVFRTNWDDKFGQVSHQDIYNLILTFNPTQGQVMDYIIDDVRKAYDRYRQYGSSWEGNPVPQYAKENSIDKYMDDVINGIKKAKFVIELGSAKSRPFTAATASDLVITTRFYMNFRIKGNKLLSPDNPYFQSLRPGQRRRYAGAPSPKEKPVMFDMSTGKQVEVKQRTTKQDPLEAQVATVLNYPPFDLFVDTYNSGRMPDRDYSVKVKLSPYSH